MIGNETSVKERRFIAKASKENGNDKKVFALLLRPTKPYSITDDMTENGAKEIGENEKLNE